MDVRKVLVVYNARKHGEHQKSLATVRSVLKRRRISSSFIIKEKAKKRMMRDVDMVLSVGGDGTFIEASHLIEDRTPLWGINSDPFSSEGVHTSATRFDFERKLRLVLDGDFSVERWSRLRTVLDGKELPPALNEVYIGTYSQYTTSRYVLHFGDKEEEQKSSGIIVTTGCGSTAWYHSAGGKPYPRDSRLIKFIVREPYPGRLTPSTITSGTVKDRLKVESKMKDGCLAIDSTKVFDFKKKRIASISLSDKPLHVVVF
jgi:NAD+ kinase